MAAVGPIPFLLFLGFGLLFAGALIGGAVKIVAWGFGRSGEEKRRSLIRMSVASLGALLIACPFAYPFLRDIYQNHLCDTESGVRVVVPPAIWSPSATSTNRIGYQQRVGTIYRSLIAPGLELDYSEISEGLGVYRSTEVFRDFGTKNELATVVTFTTKMPLVPSTVSGSLACGVPQAIGLRLHYEARAK